MVHDSDSYQKGTNSNPTSICRDEKVRGTTWYCREYWVERIEFVSRDVECWRGEWRLYALFLSLWSMFLELSVYRLAGKVSDVHDFSTLKTVGNLLRVPLKLLKQCVSVIWGICLGATIDSLERNDKGTMGVFQFRRRLCGLIKFFWRKWNLTAGYQ